MKLLVVIITLNEAANIEACLKSVAFADECIVVDSGSTDGTIEIAEKMGTRVISRTGWAGFGVQKNRALDNASGDWIFSIDADGRVSAALKEEILSALKEPVADAYRIPRSTFFCGQFLKYSGAAPDYTQQRLCQLSSSQSVISFPGSRRCGHHHAGIVCPDFAGEEVGRQLDVTGVQFMRVPDGRLRKSR